MGLKVSSVADRPYTFVTFMGRRGTWNSNLVWEAKLKDLNFRQSSECMAIKFVTPEELNETEYFNNVIVFAVDFKWLG